MVYSLTTAYSILFQCFNGDYIDKILFKVMSDTTGTMRVGVVWPIANIQPLWSISISTTKRGGEGGRVLVKCLTVKIVTLHFSPH